jgi:poly(A) polymerase
MCGNSCDSERCRQAAENICRTLEKAGHRALLAGGCVRDMLLGIPPKDYDVATSARPEEVEALFPRTYSVGAAFGVEIVLLPEGQFEVATFRKDGPYLDGRHPQHVEFVQEERDALRRDFTINAMFYEPATGKYVDYVGGREDLKRGIVRAVGDPQQRFEEDHVRLLRGVRFAGRFDYLIERETLAAIKAMAPLVRKTSAERIRDEMVKILTEGGARRAFELMDETGLLEVILPEVARMKGVAQPPEFHPEGDVFTHTMLMLELLDEPTVTLAMGALLHDVGKPMTMTHEDRIRFNKHEKAGAIVADRICRRLRFSTKERARIAWMVEQHMRVARAPEMRESKLKRFVREEGFPELLELCRLDSLASHRNLDTIHWVEDYLGRLTPEEVRPERLLTGKDLIALGFRPGPVFAEILQAVEDAQLEGTLTTSEEAKRFVLATWPGPIGLQNRPGD